MEKQPTASKGMIVIAFLCVYFFWGSTFVGIRYAVQYITPPFVSGLRYAMAGVALLAILKMRGKPINLSRGEFKRLTCIGLLMLTGNNVLLAFGEKYISASIASLIAASIPIMIALLEAAVPGGEPLSARGWMGTVLGFAGLIVLLWPSLASMPMNRGNMAAVASGVLLIGCVSWAVGSVISRRWTTKADPMLASAWQMVIGGAVNISLGTAVGGWHTAQWTRGVWMAILWLAIFGSLVGYSAYTYLLHHVAVAKVATYAYINPIVAVILGAVFLGERLRPMEYAGMGVIVVAVAIVTMSKSAAAKDLVAAKR